MARPRSEEKRTAIIEAAIEVIAEEGVAASTPAIARRARVAHGSVFHYFPTKADLINAVYLVVKTEMHRAALDGMPNTSDPMVQLEYMWTHWINWGAANPIRRRVHIRLTNEDVITAATREASKADVAQGIQIVEAVSSAGAFRGQPIEFVGRFFEALAAATIDAMIAEPKKAKKYAAISFEVLSKALR